LILKINFKKIKIKYYFNIFLNKKNNLKNKYYHNIKYNKKKKYTTSK